jgi:hypothetical protein
MAGDLKCWRQKHVKSLKKMRITATIVIAGTTATAKALGQKHGANGNGVDENGNNLSDVNKHWDGGRYHAYYRLVLAGRGLKNDTIWMSNLQPPHNRQLRRRGGRNELRTRVDSLPSAALRVIWFEVGEVSIMIKKLLMAAMVLVVASVSICGCLQPQPQAVPTPSATPIVKATPATATAAPTAKPQTVVKEVTKVIVVPAQPSPSAQPQPTVLPVPLPTTMTMSATLDLNQPGGYLGTYELYSTPKQNMGWITVYEYVNGVFIGTSTPTFYSNLEYMADPSFPTNLPKGTQYKLTIVFPGNADYAASSVTGYYIMPYWRVKKRWKK